MEQKDNKNNVPRKVRYIPKAPSRRAPKIEVKSEFVEDTDAVQARDLLQRLNQKTKSKVERKVAPSQVAFGYGGSSASIKSFGFSKGASRGSRDSINGGVGTRGLREEKEYREPWDYDSYYPVTLPIRRPYSGNPALLDEEEFASTNRTFDEKSMKSTEELGLMEDNLEPRMLLIQLPPTLPMTKQPSNKAGQEVGSSSNPAMKAGSVNKGCGIEELPAGLMGKMLVYRSGAVKLKLGDTLYDVNPGLNCTFAQDVVAVDITQKQCCFIGELNKRAILTPDIDSVLSDLSDF